LLKNTRFLRKKLAEAAPEPPPREIPEIKGALPPDPDYPYGKIPPRTAPRASPPLHEMPPKPPGANRKK